MYYIIDDMSRWIVNQRPFSRKKRRQSIRKMLNRSGVSIPEINISEKVKSFISRWVFFVALIVCGIIILIRSLFFNPEQKIVQIKFSDNTLATYQDIELFNLVSNKVRWKYYHVLSSNKEEILSAIQKQFPFVWSIQFQLEERPEKELILEEPIPIWIQLPLELPIKSFQISKTYFPLKHWIKSDEIWWILWVQINYYEPLLLVKLNDKKFAVWNENTYVELRDWMLLWIRDPEQQPFFLIETPMYLSGTTSLNWFFSELSLKDFLEIIPLAQEAFPTMKRFVYLAWSTRIAIFTDDNKTLYFNFPQWSSNKDSWDIQLQKYYYLKDRYSKFNDIWTIDLWALEENKTIIKNY